MFKREKHQKMFEVLVFLLKLSLLSILLFSIIWWGGLVFLREFTAAKISSFFNGLNFSVVQKGTSLFLGEASFSITKDCTGWKGLIFFFALVVSVKARLKEKLKALAINLPVVYSVNLLRIIGIIFLTYRYGPQTYHYLHDFLWQVVILFNVLILWTMWLRKDKF